MNEKIIPLVSEKKPTFGEQYLKGITSDSGEAKASEIRDGLLSEWDQNVMEVVMKTRKMLPSRHFYVCVTTKREYLAKNTIRNYFETKYDCPTPQFEQVVYKVQKDGTNLSILWVIPNKEACTYLRKNALHIVPEERELLRYVLDFGMGKLDQLAQKENGEIIEKVN
jgi:hypothetical protein